MDDRNQNAWGKDPRRGQPPQEGAQAQPFKLDLDFDTLELSTDIESLLEPDAPSAKGAIYFANPPKQRSHPSSRPVGVPVTPPPKAAAPEPAAPKAKTGAAQSKKKKKRQRSAHAGAIVLAVLICSLAATALFSWLGISALQDVFAMGKTSNREVELTIPNKATTADVIDILSNNKLINQKAVCKLYTNFTEWMKSKNSGASYKKPEYIGGMYLVNSGMGLEELLGFFKAQPTQSETVSLLFPEGYTMQQITEKISRYRVTSMQVLEGTLVTTDFDFPFLKNLPTSGRYFRYEGYLFPDTYEFYINENPNSALRRFFENFGKKWTDKYGARAKELGMTMDQVITLASIVQKEAANSTQMKDISGVLHNRLNRPDGYPMLECDSTRDYVTVNIAPHMDPETALLYQNVYNTYICKGLPIGPICSPGTAAIEAALWPADHSYFYFQHDKNGKIYLSKTKAEHDGITTDLVVSGLAQ
ncbi:MAG: endolytic transglycosylase MltG [Oscillospiraceae bacterium]|nr:endolytic transglycosylase MltG [Oscillospiraceae bacterium]